MRVAEIVYFLRSTGISLLYYSVNTVASFVVTLFRRGVVRSYGQAGAIDLLMDE